jgi:microsomal dipeptidase-like Zn-dependent dipeptidase
MNRAIWALDAHCDSVYVRQMFGGTIDLSSEAVRISEQKLAELFNIFNNEGDGVSEIPCVVTLSGLRQGNVRAIFMNVGDLDLGASRAMIRELSTIIQKYPADIQLFSSVDNVRRAADDGKLTLIPSIEGMLMFKNQLELLSEWHAAGVKVASLTHGEGAEAVSEYEKFVLGEEAEAIYKYALQVTPSTDELMSIGDRDTLYKRQQGLTDFGKSALLETARLGIVCDLSHANDATFWEALEFSNGKFCATHSNCAALCSHSRNLTDQMMKALAEHGGVLGLCFFGEYIDNERPSMEKFLKHILHALKVMGADHVGIGSDYDGVPQDAFMAVSRPEKMPSLWKMLSEAGIDEDIIFKIAHDNFLRLVS